MPNNKFIWHLGVPLALRGLLMLYHSEPSDVPYSPNHLKWLKGSLYFSNIKFGCVRPI